MIKIGLKDDCLDYTFNKFHLTLHHFHYDRFDTEDDERYGKTSLNFLTNPQGDIDKISTSLDQAEVVFVRKAPSLESELLKMLPGTYETASGAPFRITLKDDAFLYIISPGQPDVKLIPYKDLVFKLDKFSDVLFEFVLENGDVTMLKQRSPSGEYVYIRLPNS